MKINHKTRLRLLSVMFLVPIGISSVQSADNNLILNAPYTYYPNPEYSYSTDAGDKTDLTNGKALSTLKTMWKVKSTVGWVSKPDVPIVIMFKLKEEASLSKLMFNTVGGGGSGIMDPDIAVYGSLDNKSYVPLGKSIASTTPDPITTYLLKKTIPLQQTRAKYIAVVATPPAPSYFVFVDEIELFGNIPASPSSKLPTSSNISGSSAKDLYEIFKTNPPKPEPQGFFSGVYQTMSNLFGGK
ncbi:MAG: hypothetical protein KAH03_05835 [Cocleimonas sp.]|nr:hypothetical protein [Cocleimonas sp.]